MLPESEGIVKCEACQTAPDMEQVVSKCWSSLGFLVFFLSFCYFFGPLLRHMEVPRLGVESEL